MDFFYCNALFHIKTRDCLKYFGNNCWLAGFDIAVVFKSKRQNYSLLAFVSKFICFDTGKQLQSKHFAKCCT